LKHAVYLSDAIPAPGWPEHKYFVKGLKRFIRKSLSNIDALFTLNKEMLLYQISTFLPKPRVITGTFPFGCRYHLLDYANDEKEINYFVYAGSIYGARKPNYLLIAFERLLDIFPSSKLVFIGTWKDNPPFHRLRPNTIDNIITLPFQENLNSFFRKATGLINIDAEIPNDVFLSSKMGDYLPVNRIIINETGENSPSRNLFKGIQSVIHCDHDSTQLFEAMKFSISMKDSMDYEDRKPLIEELYIDNVANRFNETLRRLYDEK
jgi:glycosyltransferase involved in cell wall biosynthesis